MFKSLAVSQVAAASAKAMTAISAIALSTAISIAISIASSTTPAYANDQDDLYALSRATTVVYYEMGDSNQPSPIWRIFDRLRSSPTKGNMSSMLKGKIAAATPAGKIYLLLIERELDPIGSSHVMGKLLKTKDKVVYKKGCAVETTTVEELCRRIAAGKQVVKLTGMPEAKDLDKRR